MMIVVLFVLRRVLVSFCWVLVSDMLRMVVLLVVIFRLGRLLRCIFVGFFILCWWLCGLRCLLVLVKFGVLYLLIVWR